MPLYEHRCTDCGQFHTDDAQAPRGPCPGCGGLLRRSYRSVRFGTVLHGHFNHSLGHYVDGRRGFAEGLKRQSEEATLRTGVEHNYEPVDLSDRSAVGVTDEGLESFNERHAELNDGMHVDV